MKTFVIAASAAFLTTSAFAQTQFPPSAGNVPVQPNAAQTSASDKGQQAQKISSATQQFAQKAAISDMFEIQTGPLAQQKAASDEYKKFCQMNHENQSKKSDQVKGLARDLPGLQPTQGLDAGHKQKLDKLQSLSNAAF